MERLLMTVVLPIVVVACVALLASAVGMFFLSLGNGALVAAFGMVVLVMVVASVVNAQKSAPEEGKHDSH